MALLRIQRYWDKDRYFVFAKQRDGRQGIINGSVVVIGPKLSITYICHHFYDIGNQNKVLLLVFPKPLAC